MISAWARSRDSASPLSTSRRSARILAERAVNWLLPQKGSQRWRGGIGPAVEGNGGYKGPGVNQEVVAQILMAIGVVLVRHWGAQTIDLAPKPVYPVASISVINQDREADRMATSSVFYI